METKDGFLVINKDKGCTSHDCVKQIRKLLNTKKVGHTGTLDPEVTGILPIAIGSATRFIQYLPQGKTYLVCTSMVRELIKNLSRMNFLN